MSGDIFPGYAEARREGFRPVSETAIGTGNDDEMLVEEMSDAVLERADELGQICDSPSLSSYTVSKDRSEVLVCGEDHRAVMYDTFHEGSYLPIVSTTVVAADREKDKNASSKSYLDHFEIPSNASYQFQEHNLRAVADFHH